MSNEISTNVSFGQEITNKVRQLIMNAMPEEKIQEVLKAEYDSFFVKRNNGYGGASPSKFEELVANEVRDLMKNAIKEQVKAYLSPIINNHGSEAAIAILAEITPEVQKAMARELAMDSARFILNNLQSRPY